METKNSFDRLAGELNIADRLEMLKKIGGTVDPATQILEPPVSEEQEKSTIETKLRTESFFLRIWLYIKSLFSSSDLQYEYNMYLLGKKGYEIERNYPDVINYKRGILCNNFFMQLTELQKVALFFKPGLSLYEEDPGKFYVYLGSLLLPDFTSKAEAYLDFSLLPTDKEPSNELRSSLLRQLDDQLQQIPLSARNNLYAAIRSAEWLKNFVKLPFERLLTRFINVTGNAHTCQIDSAATDISGFARVLCNGGRMHSEVLEALATFSAQVQTRNHEENLNEKAAELLKKSVEQISRIKTFITLIPLRSLGAIAFRSVFWEPEKLEGSEDWFVKFKSHWKKKFEQNWDFWIKDKQRQQIKDRVKSLLSMPAFPLLPNRPWTAVLDGVPFSCEYTIGFIYEFFQKLYPLYNKSLRILMAEGEFVQRENRMEFTDTYSELNHLAADIERYNVNLSPQGEQGKLFAKIVAENIRTIHGRTQVTSIMFALESEASLHIANFTAACRSLLAILGGITDEVRDVRYGTLQNLSTIQGKLNTQFRAQLRSVRHGLLQVFDLLKNLEVLDAE